jgi:hypothetical protein
MTEQEQLLAERIERERLREWAAVNGVEWGQQKAAAELVAASKSD